MTQTEFDKIFEEGISAYENGDMDTAEQKFLSALQFNPGSEEIRYNLALVYLEKKEYRKTDRLIANIHEIDCSEILDELEKQGYDSQVEIPDKIPPRCGQCAYFNLVSLVRENSGFCSFYNIHTNRNSRCHAFKLAEAGVIEKETIEARLNKSINEQIDALTASLDDEYLPEKIYCDHCSKEIAINETGKMTQKYVCPECGSAIDVRNEVNGLEKDFRNKNEHDLFLILLNPSDFKNAYPLAARKEIKRRAIDLRNNNILIQLMTGED
ncbi:MAG: hypothetical protein JXR46_11915 [Calditrichaceae bacterium]|nr:hypothetical protein [Calditrichaceae bacterium]MBN2709741.1 hypothetical protein [Calditrichaceae bacterium]RQV94077.1 MAG: hypothetical protein EH224_11085 [Calditrichota bacterium]